MLDLTAALRRRTAATLPWGTRTANMFFHLRIAVTSVSDGFGQVIRGIYHLIGVTDLPPLDNPPTNLRQIDNRHVPPAYAREYGRRAMAWALKRLKDKERAEEFLVSFMGQITDKVKKGLLRSIEGKTVDEADRFVITMMTNYLNDQRRSEGRKPLDDKGEDISDRQDMLGDVVDEASQIDIDSAARAAAKEISSRWPDSGITEEDVSTYLRLISEDVSDAQIIGKRMLPFLEDRASFSPAAWTKYKQMILNKVTDVLKTASFLVRNLDEDLVFASEETQAVTSGLVQKTASLVGRVALQFSSPEALREYLREHPNADPKKHTVTKREDGSSGSGGRTTVEVKDKGLAKDLSGLGTPQGSAVNQVSRLIEQGEPVSFGMIDKAVKVLHSQANNPGQDKEKAKKMRELKTKLEGLGREK